MSSSFSAVTLGDPRMTPERNDRGPATGVYLCCPPLKKGRIDLRAIGP